MATGETICPRGFLRSPSPSVSSSSFPPQRRSIVQALTDPCNIPINQLPNPCLKGDAISIKISEDEYKKGLEGCKNNLHGRLLLSKGDQPIKIQDLRAKLLCLWKPIEKWRVVPLGKGFYEFSFALAEDLRSVWDASAWNLQPGILRLSQWSLDFNPSNQKITHAQCWIRIYELSQDYWRPKILFEIAGSLGTPISLDDATRNRVFGHYARVLVDVHLNEILFDRILLEREDYAFFVGIDYERLPSFCPVCQIICHSITNCNKQSKKAILDKDQHSVPI